MKIQNEMATRISVDTVAAIGSMKAFRDAVNASGNAWRAQENVLKSSGQYYDALKTRISGLNHQIDLQKAKVAELRQRQEGLDQTNKKQAVQWLSLEKQISQANKQLSGYEGQLNRAKDHTSYYASGLANLQHQMRLNSKVGKSYVASLRAQGDTSKANRAELGNLTSRLADLRKEEYKQEFLLKQVSHQSGESSEAYKRQQIELNKTRESIGHVNARMKQLKSEMGKTPTSGLTMLKQHILQVDNAEQKAGKSAINFKKLLASSVIGGAVTAGLNTITTNFTTIITQGMQVAKVGAAMEARWKNIGVSARGVKQLSAQVSDLKTNTNLTAQTVNSLQSRFYGMTHSISQTKLLTKGVASLSDQLKLSDKQANAFAGGLSRIESSGKVTSRSLGRLEKQAPGLTAAMAKASGMSQKSFQQLVSSGKMTSDQFNQILAKASKDYGKNAKAFDRTSGGALHKLQQEWLSTQAKLAKPLLKVSATGLNELSKSLSNKDVQKGLSSLASGMAKVAIAGTKLIGFFAKYSRATKTAIAVTATLWGYFKAARLVTNLSLGISKLVIGMKGISNAEKAAAVTQKALNVAMRANAIGLIITAIAGLMIGLRGLYKHSKTFRKFVNGIWKSVKGFGKNIGKFFGQIGKTVAKGWQAITKKTSKSLSNMRRNREKYDRQQIKAHQKAMRENRRTWNTISRNTAKTSKSMWRKASRDARNGWNYVVRWGGRSTKNIARDWDKMNRSTAKVAQRMFRKHKQTFKAGYKVLQDRTRTWHDVMTGHWNRLSRDTQRTSRDMSKYHQRLFGDMFNKLNNMTGGRLGDMVKAWQSKMGSIGDTVANAKKAIHDHFVDLVRGIIKPFNDMLEDLHKGINWVLEKVGASKIGGTWSVPMPSYAVGTPGTHPGGLAKVNDAPTGHYRELYRLPNGKMGMFPAIRNMIVPLPKGTSVLDGERSYQLSKMMGIIPHYADGTLDAVGNFFGNLKDDVENFMDNTEKFIAHPIEFMESVFKKFVKVSTPVKFATDLVQHVPVYIAKQMAKWVKKQLEVMANPGGAGVARWRPYVLRALKMLHLSTGLVDKVLRQIKTESGGNPLARQKGADPDGDGSGPALGLMQTKMATFNAYKLPGHGNLWNGFDDILAGLNYALHRYGPGLSALGNGHGYANGGFINQHGFYEIGEFNRPEAIIPLDLNKRSRAYQLLGQIVSRFHAGEPQSSATISSRDHEELQQMNRKFDTLLSMMSQMLGVSGDQLQAIKDQGSFDMKSLYKRQARDAAMRAFS